MGSLENVDGDLFDFAKQFFMNKIICNNCEEVYQKSENVRVY